MFRNEQTNWKNTVYCDSFEALKLDKLKKENKALIKALKDTEMKLKELNKEYTKLKNINSKLKDNSMVSCIICNSNIKSILYDECKHLVACEDCSKNLTETCPFCRKKSKKVKIYL
jgi:hypothetical protein